MDDQKLNPVPQHIRKLRENLAMPRVSWDESERQLRDLEKMRLDLKTFEQIAKAHGHTARIVKAMSLDASRNEIPALEQDAKAKVAVAKDYGRRIAEKLRSFLPPPERDGLLARFDDLCITARAACIAVVRACYTVLATSTDAAEAEAIAAKAGAWLDAAANIRDVVAPV